jgi:hypothetical protein
MLSVLASLALILSACNNIGNAARSLAAVGATSNDSFSSTSAGDFVLQELVPDATSPGTIIDLIGTNSQFDTYCTLGTCMCEFTYTATNGGTITSSVANTYEESNMLRCPNIIPSGVVNFSVRITVISTGTNTTGVATPTPIPGDTAGEYVSNSVTGTFSSGALAGTSEFMDLSNAASYVPVQRFQCRKREFIPNPMNPGMIDPFQSQNPAVIYPFNYYTTNLGSSLLNQQQATDTTWECTITGTQDHSVQWWANPNVFSSATCTTSFCSGDGDLIYPQTTLTSGKIPVTDPTQTGKRRSSFSLASQSYGVFGVAVQAAIAPVSYVAASYATIGYGAAPIPSANGTSTCPNITLPPNSTWVKLWNFRATDIASAQKVTGSQSIASTAIACDSEHPGDGKTSGSELFPSCEMENDTSSGGAPFGISLQSLGTANTTGIASRVAMFTGASSTSTSSTTTSSASASACYNFSPANAVAQIPWHNSNPGSPSTYAGADVWIPSAYAFDTTITTPGSVAIAGYPWNEYLNTSGATATSAPYKLDTVASGATPYNVWLKYNGSFAIPAATPMDFSNQLTTVALSTDNYTDQIFVVTDPSVSDSDMLNNASSIQQYVPRTFRAASDCPGPAACDPVTTGKTPITWGLNTEAVGVESGTAVYPLCVLQFYD